MIKFRAQLDGITVRYTQWLLRHPWMVIGAALLSTALLIAGLHNFVLGNDYADFFDADDPRVVAYEQVKQDYTNDDTVFFVVTAKSGEIFERETLEAIAYLTEKAWNIPYATRVDSLANFQHAWAEEDDLLVRGLVESPADMDEVELAEARTIAFQEPILLNRLIKDGSAVTGVNVTLKLPEDVPRVSTVVTEAAKELTEETMALFPSVAIRLTGIVPLNDSFLQGAYKDLYTLVPLMVLIILVIMAVLLKSIVLMLSVVAVVLLASLSAIGLLSWLGYETSGPVTVLPLIVLTLAVADCVHILVSMQTCMRKGMDKAAAIVESMRINMAPVFVTSLTTAIGFLCMNITPVPMLRVLGNFTAAGVLIAYLLAVTLLPALVSRLPFRVRLQSSDATVRSCMKYLGEFVLANKAVLLFGLGAITLLIAVNITSIRVNNQFIEWFDKSVPIRQDTEYAMDNLTGIYQLVFNVPAKESGGINDPEYLARLDNFVNWMGKQDGVVHVSSITSTMKRLNQAMHGDDPALYRIPESREMAAQYLLLYEMSLPMGVDLNMEVNMDKSATRVVATTHNLSTEEMSVLIGKVEKWQQQNFPAEMMAPALGPAVMFAHVAHTMMESMFLSAPLAILLVSLVLMMTLRSIKYGLVSLLPNLMPLAIGFGIWGYLGKDMSFSMTTIVAMSIGIVVDDTVHFLSKYLRARRELGLSPEDGIRYTFNSVGKAMWVTSFILVAGFSVMILSPMAYSGNMGLLTSIIVVAALAGDFLLLPSILIYTDGQREPVYATLKEGQHKERAVVVKA